MQNLLDEFTKGLCALHKSSIHHKGLYISTLFNIFIGRNPTTLVQLSNTDEWKSKLGELLSQRFSSSKFDGRKIYHVQFLSSQLNSPEIFVRSQCRTPDDCTVCSSYSNVIINRSTETKDIHEITSKWEGPTVQPGDILFFNCMLPHAPELNTSGKMRIASYVFLAPLLQVQDVLRPADTTVSFLPNTVHDLQTSRNTGSCIPKAPHPCTHDEMEYQSRTFYPALEYTPFPIEGVGLALYGDLAWAIYERSEEAQHLYGKSSMSHEERLHFVRTTMAQSTLASLKKRNDDMERKVSFHESHRASGQRNAKGCSICDRLKRATTLQWQHTTEAARHKYLDKTDPNGCRGCKRCKEIGNLGWNGVGHKGGCLCPACAPFRKKK